MSLPGSKGPSRSRWSKRLAWAGVAFLVYVLLGFFALPPLIRWQLLKRLPGLTQRRAAIREVKFNPLALSLTLRGLELTEPDGRTFASWEELYINFQSSSLFRWAWTFDEIRLVKPFGEVILDKDGQLNFANMFPAPVAASPAPKTPPAGIPRVNIFLLQVTNGVFVFEDRTHRIPFRTEYRPINVTLTQFTTRPDANTPYSFRAESDAGRSVTWAGDLSVQPLRSAGHLEVTGVNLSRYEPYAADFIRAIVTNGLADVKFDYRFETGTNGVDLFATNGLVHVERMQLQDPDNGEIVAGLVGFDIRQAQLNLRAQAVRFGSVKLAGAALLARLKQNGHVNLLDLLPPPTPATNSATAAAARSTPPWSVTVDDVTIESTAVTFEDLTRRTPFKTQLKPIELKVQGLSTKPNSDARYSFHLVTEASETVAGSGSFSLNPIRSAGEIKVAAFELKKYLPYADDFFRGHLTAGHLQLQAPYAVAWVTNRLQAAVSNLSLTLTGLEIKTPDTDETVATLSTLAVEGVEADLQQRRGRIGLVRVSGGYALARRKKDGSLNFFDLLPSATTNRPAAAVPSSPAGSNGAWAVKVDELAVQDFALTVDDQQPAKPAVFRFDQVAVRVRDVTTDPSLPVSVALSLRLNESGLVAAQGTARLSPLSAEIELGMTNIDLRAAQSYLAPIVPLAIVSGGFGLSGQANYQAADTSAPQLKFAGALSITNFLCTDQVAFNDFVRWTDLSVSGIECELFPHRLKVAEIKWVEPRASLMINSNHESNLSLILMPGSGGTSAVPPPGSSSAAPATAKPADVVPIQVDAFALERASFAFADESILPHANVSVQELSGTIKALSSALNTTADVDLAGKLDQQSPFAIAGRVNPLAADLFVDLVISNANTQLTPLTPYLEKYAGHPLNRGLLSTTLRYHVEHKELKAENKVAIDHLTLGPRNNSPDATSLPVKLAVALLKDNNGRIELDLPLHGRTDDPQFSVAPLILKVLLNTLEKAVASPFKLLGALAGGGEELSFIQFNPGSTNLVDGEMDKLTKLTKALAQRPALNLEIEGSVDPAADRDALAKTKLREQLKSQCLRELAARGKAPQALEGFQLPPEDYQRLLRASFAEHFGTNIAAVLRTNQQTMAAGSSKTGLPAGQPKAPMYQRVLALVGLGAQPPKSTAEKHLPKADRLALAQATPDFMERLVAAQIPVTEDDFRALMTLRAGWVQDWLSHNGQVAPERLLLVAPKPLNPNAPGRSRANLSLD